MSRREYATELTINNRPIKKIIIDTHYEEKHSDSINDEIILTLTQQLDGSLIDPEKQVGKFSYFVNDRMLLNNKVYRLVWLLEEDELYVGIVNCHRR